MTDLVPSPRPERGQTAEGNRGYKQRLVVEGRAHAALIFDGDMVMRVTVPPAG